MMSGSFYMESAGLTEAAWTRRPGRATAAARKREVRRWRMVTWCWKGLTEGNGRAHADLDVFAGFDGGGETGLADDIDGGGGEFGVGRLDDGDVADAAGLIDDVFDLHDAGDGAACGGGRVGEGDGGGGARGGIDVADLEDFQAAEFLLVDLKGGQGEVAGEAAAGAGIEGHVELFEADGRRRRVQLGRGFVGLGLRGRRRFVGRRRRGRRGDFDGLELLGLLFGFGEELRKRDGQKQRGADGRADGEPGTEGAFAAGRLIEGGHRDERGAESKPLRGSATLALRFLAGGGEVDGLGAGEL